MADGLPFLTLFFSPFMHFMAGFYRHINVICHGLVLGLHLQNLILTLTY